MGFTTLLRGLLAAAAAALLAVTMLATASPASAGPDARSSSAGAEKRLDCRRTCFGAISVNAGTGIAYSRVNYATKAAAIRAAQRGCRNDSGDEGVCRKAGWMRNACGAVAYRINNGALQEWAFAWAERERAAVTKAKRKVRGPGAERKWISACTAN